LDHESKEELGRLLREAVWLLETSDLRAANEVLKKVAVRAGALRAADYSVGKLQKQV
jgi:acyl carrier protein phosphodiesterase